MNEIALRAIRARFHDSAVSRVTRLYAATLADIFAETLQNARRAGATRVRVALTDTAGRMTVTLRDDGAGIADPVVLLSFGENGWDAALVAAEDAAGMGMLSLARRGCTVASRPRSTAVGWWVDLAPEHFLGETEAQVHADEIAPLPHGTAVSFPVTESEDARTVRRAIENAARHYPLPVFYEHEPNTPAGGERLEHRTFLDGAQHIERWRGLAFGVFRNRRSRSGLDDPDLNFYGLAVAVRLPSIQSVTGTRWTVAADVADCPDLELVLPARKEAVETPFLGEMRAAARLAIYRAMAADPNPRPAHDDWTRAHAAGIEIAPPPPELRPWRPGLADIDDWREPPNFRAIGADALRMACDPEPPEAQSFWRAAGRNGVAERIFESDRRLEGYGWYDAIPRIVGLRTTVTREGRTHALDAYPVPKRAVAPQASLPDRPEAIRIALAVRPPQGPEQVLDLDADLAFAGEAWSRVGDAQPLVAAGSALDPHELADLLRAAFFSPSDEADADSWERQRELFDEEALHIATRLLVSDDAARRASIADAVARELFWLIPHDRGVEIAVRDRQVTVTLGEPVTEDAR